MNSNNVVPWVPRWATAHHRKTDNPNVIRAFINDDLDTLKSLQHGQPDPKYGALEVTHDTIREACRHGSHRCLEHLILEYPALCRVNHKANPNPFALAFSKCLKTSRVLFQRGAPWTRKDFVREFDGRTILHVIYRYAHHSWMQELTELAFSCGYNKPDVNLTNCSGLTPTHVLVGRILKGPEPDIPGQDYILGSDDERKDVSDSVLETLELLRSSGVDLHAVDTSGKGVIHYLLDRANDRIIDVYTTRDPNPYPRVNKVLAYLLERGVNVNACEIPLTSTPLTLLTSAFVDTSMDEMDRVWDDIYVTYKILFEYGADANVEDNKGVNPVSLILTAANRWMRMIPHEKDITSAVTYVARLRKIIELFLAHGYNPSPDLFEFNLKQIGVCLNILEEGVDLVPLLRGVRNLVLPFFISGYDPNRLIMVRKKSIGHLFELNARFYVSRALIIHRQTGAATEFLTIFENTLDNPSLNNFVSSICQVLVTDFPHTSKEENVLLVNRIMAVVFKPRSLKSLCRISIAKAMDWNLVHRVDFLPLPSMIKYYLTDF